MELLIQYAMSFIGVPYKWGGENPISGFDCSGLVQEILRSVGLDPPGDQTAQMLYMHFLKDSYDAKDAGALAFYGESLRKITHIAMMIDPLRIIEAGGGGSKTKTKEDADLANAFVRIRPLNHRSDLLAVLMPNYMKVPGFKK